jgi:hypothetical protein
MVYSVRGVAVFRSIEKRFPGFARVCAVFVAALCVFAPTAEAAGDPFRYKGGLRNSPGERKLNSRQMDDLLKSLRVKSGFIEMRFDDNGFLTLGDRTKFAGGSETARSLLRAAVDMPHAVDMENHNYSSVVAFARLGVPVSYRNMSNGKSMDVYRLEIDFSDRNKLRGDSKALAAFDVGFIILHELGHAAFGLRDFIEEEGDLGECENHINRIRRELSLPERQTYIAQVSTQTPMSPHQVTTKLAELTFSMMVERKGRMVTELYNLKWEALKVGPIVDIPTQIVTRDRRGKTGMPSASGQ